MNRASRQLSQGFTSRNQYGKAHKREVEATPDVSEVAIDAEAKELEHAFHIVDTGKDVERRLKKAGILRECEHPSAGYKLYRAVAVYRSLDGVLETCTFGLASIPW